MNEHARRDLVRAVEGIAGWSHASELWELHEAVRTGASAGPITAVEIGSYEGRSTIALARGLAARRDRGGRVIAVDPHARPGQYETFLANLAAARVRELVDDVRLPSHDARARFGDRFASVLFVDGLHEYEQVMQDIRDWATALVPGAVVAFNDPWLPGVRRALVGWACRTGSPFRNARWLVNTVFFDFLPDEPWTRRDAVRAFRLNVFLSAGRIWSRVWPRPSAAGGDDTGRFRTVLDMRVALPALRAILPLARTAGDWISRRRV